MSLFSEDPCGYCTAHEWALMSESPISTYLRGQKGDFHCSGAGSPLSSSFSEVEGGGGSAKCFIFIG